MHSVKEPLGMQGEASGPGFPSCSSFCILYQHHLRLKREGPVPGGEGGEVVIAQQPAIILPGIRERRRHGINQLGNLPWLYSHPGIFPSPLPSWKLLMAFHCLIDKIQNSYHDLQGFSPPGLACYSGWNLHRLSLASYLPGRICLFPPALALSSHLTVCVSGKPPDHHSHQSLFRRIHDCKYRS